jgi:hypothetical protein
MSATQVESLEAETAIRDLRTTMAQHRRQEAMLRAAPRAVGRLRRRPLGGTSADVRCQGTLLRLSSIVEAFTARSLVRRLEHHAPPPRTTVLDDIYNRAEDNATGSWPRMTEHYARWFKIKISRKSCPCWQRIEAMTHARNAVAHGLGEITPRLAKMGSTKLAEELATVDVGTTATSVVITERSLQACESAGAEFIAWLDGELRIYDSRSPTAP